MPTAVEQMIEHLKQDIATVESRARKAEALVPHIAEKYRERLKTAIESSWQQAKELNELLVEIQKDHPGN